ncbi:helix-turn-helix domain-containing protein [Streptomyces sp. NBRC 109706]|uniref:helix-turn-helix domain-containing protein n=1 Tax=Streptomyces sp. NBRC 109706 TaxID=1550035 RepID=UPI0007867DF1|nr:helix-turn-helix transcriptional regulator [Streptomyces sp. NBRC 109706]
MPADSPAEVGRRIAYHRHLANLTQDRLADRAGLGSGTLPKIERGARLPSDHVLQSIADALGIDPASLREHHLPSAERAHTMMPNLRAILASWDDPDDGPTRFLPELREAVDEVQQYRLAAQYARIMREGPALLAEALRALAAAQPAERAEAARIAISACRTVDAAAYKYGAVDLSGRIIDTMRWLAHVADDPITHATVAYVRTEQYFASRAHAAGQRALERAIDVAPAPTTSGAVAARAALHMRAAVIAARAGDGDAADEHTSHATRLAETVREGVYAGTAVGPDSVRIHQVSLSVSLGGTRLGQALAIAREWAPPRSMCAERRSGFYIEMARAQLHAGHPGHAFEALKVAQRLAPQHVREHRWVREDISALIRRRKTSVESLTSFAQWCGAE